MKMESSYFEICSNGWTVSVRRDHGADVQAPSDNLQALLSIQRALSVAMADVTDAVSRELVERMGG